MFDDFLRARAASEGGTFVAFDPVHDYHEWVDGKRRSDGVRSFLASRGIDLSEGSPGDPAGSNTVAGLGNRKNALVLAVIHERGVQTYEGSVRFVRAVRDAGLRRAVVSSSANCREVLEAAGIAEPVRGAGRRNRRRPRPPERQACARHVPGGRTAGRGDCRARRRSSRTRSPASRRASRRFRPRRRRRPHRRGRRAARARRRHRRLRPGRVAGDAVIAQSDVRRRALGAARVRPRPRDARAGGVAVRALERPSRLARESRRGRAVRPARHVPELVLRVAAAAVRRGRLRIPGVRPDDRQRDQRQDHPPARRRRAARRALRRAALARARARPAGGRAVAQRGMAIAGWHRRSRALDAPRLVRPAIGRRDPLRGRAARGSGARRRPVLARGQRAGAAALGRSAHRGRARIAARLRGLLRPRRACGAVPFDPRQQAVDGRREWTT